LLFEEATTLRPSFVKTQFAGASVHVAVVELFRTLEEHFDRIEVTDEVEYWESSSLPRLAENLRQVESMLRQNRARQPGAIGPLLLPSRRIVDVVDGGSLDLIEGPVQPLPEETRVGSPRGR
jgi:hypothetical protein